MPDVSLRQIVIGALAMALALVLGLAALSNSGWVALGGGAGRVVDGGDASLDPQPPPEQLLSLEMGVSSQVGPPP